MDSNIVQIRKKGGIDKIFQSKNGSRVRPMLFSSQTKNRKEDGNPEGDYKGKSLLDTKHFISPMWNDLKKRWSFSGSANELSALVDKMKLRYPKNHQFEGQLIKSSPEDVERLTNRSDDVFNHPSLYGKYFMENSRVSLDISNPVQKFLYLCYKGDTSVQDKSSDKLVSKYFTAGARYELISPRKENQKARSHANKEIRAITLLGNMGEDEDKMRAIASIMALPQYSPSTDKDGVFVLLKDMAAQNTEMSSKYKKSYQDRFIELAEMDTEDLNMNNQVVVAKNAGHIRLRKDYFLFDGERIEGISTDNQLFAYFKNPKNQKQYIKLIDLIET